MQAGPWATLGATPAKRRVFFGGDGLYRLQEYVSSWMQYQSLWEINTSAVGGL